MPRKRDGFVPLGDVAEAVALPGDHALTRPRRLQLSKEEFDGLRSQTGISSWGGRRYTPYAFTEQGVAMLSGILRSKTAVQVNVAIMRTFVRLRRMLAAN